MFQMLSNQHYPHPANQKLCSWANAVFQNHGVCGQAVPSFPFPSPIIHFFLSCPSFLDEPREETLAMQARLTHLWHPIKWVISYMHSKQTTVINSPISCLNNALLHLSPSANACQIQILKFTFTLILYHVTISDRSKGGAGGLITTPSYLQQNKGPWCRAQALIT